MKSEQSPVAYLQIAFRTKKNSQGKPKLNGCHAEKLFESRGKLKKQKNVRMSDKLHDFIKKFGIWIVCVLKKSILNSFSLSFSYVDQNMKSKILDKFNRILNSLTYFLNLYHENDVSSFGLYEDMNTKP